MLSCMAAAFSASVAPIFSPASAAANLDDDEGEMTVDPVAATEGTLNDQCLLRQFS